MIQSDPHGLDGLEFRIRNCKQMCEHLWIHGPTRTYIGRCITGMLAALVRLDISDG